MEANLAGLVGQQAYPERTRNPDWDWRLVASVLIGARDDYCLGPTDPCFELVSH